MSPAASLRVIHVGHEGEPVLILDRATGQADALRQFATDRSVFEPAAGLGSGYPGLLGTAPTAYVDALVRLALPLIERHFTAAPVRPARARGNFSLVTFAPDALSPDQCAPHVDAADRMQFAAVHFLSPHNADGTGFFRHRATGFETIDADRLAAFQAARAAEPTGEAEGYVAGDHPRFDRIGAVEAAYDRLILYRAALLHSGLISRIPDGADDPRHGRLTGNLFLLCRTAA